MPSLSTLTRRPDLLPTSSVSTTATMSSLSSPHMSDLFDLPFEDDARESEEAPQPVASRRVYTVTELTVRVRDQLEEQFFEVWVEGEISNCRLWNTGHLYFTLKDSSSQLRGFMFRSALRYLRFKPADGLRVVARGRLSVYEPKGECQLVCEHLEPQGLGALQLAFDQLKKRLLAEGLFDVARKRPLPALPRKIGVVTSLDGAAIRDIIKVLRRRYTNAHVVIRPTRVQGDGAAAEIADGVRAIARVPEVDVVIVGRGGGSIEDLWAFNQEPVARAIAACPLPVITDVRAPTPSAAAELVVTRKDEFIGRIDRLHDRLVANARGRVQRLSRRVHELSGRRAIAGYTARLAMIERHADELARAMTDAMRAAFSVRDRQLRALERRLDASNTSRRLARDRTRLVTADGALQRLIAVHSHRARMKLGRSAGRLETLSPLGVLSRGYAVCWNEDRTRAIRDASDVAPGDTVHVTLSRGAIAAKVSRTE